MIKFQEKVAILKRRLRELESAVVAFSGGVDSSVLVVVAHEELKDRMIAVTGVSPSLPNSDRVLTRDFCRIRGIPHSFAQTSEFEDTSFIKNPDDRCYYCKSHLYNSLLRLADEMNFKFVVEGTNANDLSGHRPGYRASCENARVVTPLVDAKFTKDDVRALARDLMLETADKSAAACLSSRIPTGTNLDAGVLKKIDAAEDVIRSFGVTQVRVRHHDELARVEVLPDDFNICLGKRDLIAAALRDLGWKFVTLDLLGYRTGGMRG